MNPPSPAITAYQNWKGTFPPNPVIGDMFYDMSTSSSYMWDGKHWRAVGLDDIPDIDTNHPDQHRIDFEHTEQEVFDKHPELKELWDEYKIIRRLKTGR